MTILSPDLRALAIFDRFPAWRLPLPYEISTVKGSRVLSVELPKPGTQPQGILLLGHRVGNLELAARIVSRGRVRFHTHLLVRAADARLYKGLIPNLRGDEIDLFTSESLDHRSGPDGTVASIAPESLEEVLALLDYRHQSILPDSILFARA